MTGREIAIAESENGLVDLPAERISGIVRDAASVEQTFVANLSEHWRLAKMLVASGLLPDVIREPEQAMAIMLKGHELNLPPMQSFSSIHIINGKPTLAASLMMALCIRDAGCRFDIIRKDATGCVIDIHRSGWKTYRASFLEEDAQRVKIKSRNGTIRLTEKDTWKNYPTSMYFSRAASDACRTLCPDILAGMYTPEELEITGDTNDLIPEPVQQQADTALETIRTAVEHVRTGLTKEEEEPAEIEPEAEENLPEPVEEDLKEGIGPVAMDVDMPEGYSLVSTSPGWYLIVDIETNTPISDKKFHKDDGREFAYKYARKLEASKMDANSLRRAIGGMIAEVGWEIKIVGDFAQTLFGGSDALTDPEGRVSLALLGDSELLEIWDAVVDAVELHNAGEDIPLISRDTLVSEVVSGAGTQDDLGL